MKLVKVLVSRGKMMAIPRIVGVHEVPVLQSVHGEAAVHVVEDAGECASPDPAEEYGRLQRVYGVDADRNATHAELVYGRGPAQLAAVLAEDAPRGRRVKEAA